MAYLLLPADGDVLWPRPDRSRLHQLGQVRRPEGGDQGRTERVPTPPADPVQVDQNFAEALGLTDQDSTSR